MRQYTQWRWLLDEVFVKIYVVQHDLRRAMSRFRRMSSLQNFAADHAPVDKHFSHQRNIERRTRFKTLRDAVLTEWPCSIVNSLVPLERLPPGSVRLDPDRS